MTLWPGYTRPPGHSPGDRAAGDMLNNTSTVTLALPNTDMTSVENSWHIVNDGFINVMTMQTWLSIQLLVLSRLQKYISDITRCTLVSSDGHLRLLPAIHAEATRTRCWVDWRWPDTCQLRTELPWLRTEDKVTRLLLFPHNLLLSLNCCNANIVTQHNNQTWLVIINVHIDLNWH